MVLYLLLSNRALFSFGLFVFIFLIFSLQAHYVLLRNLIGKLLGLEATSQLVSAQFAEVFSSHVDRIALVILELKKVRYEALLGRPVLILVFTILLQFLHNLLSFVGELFELSVVLQFGETLGIFVEFERGRQSVLITRGSSRLLPPADLTLTLHLLPQLRVMQHGTLRCTEQLMQHLLIEHLGLSRVRQQLVGHELFEYLTMIDLLFDRVVNK